MEKPDIVVIGTGYVGLTSAVTFALHGFTTVCTDILPSKIDNLRKGIPPFYEPGLKDRLGELVSKGMLYGSTDNLTATRQSDVSFICVGTPTLDNGMVDLTAIKAAAKDIGTGLRERHGYHLVVVKSTVPPGTSQDLILPIVKKYSQKKVGKDFGLCMNPEFLRQGEALHDSLNPDRIVIGEYDKKSGDVLEHLYTNYNCPKLRCDIVAAELIKYVANSFLATKISFANEFSRICEEFQVDVYEIMKGVGLDFRINPRFFNAGCGFGGSCFPKDVNAIITMAKTKGVETPLLDSVLYTNEVQPLHCVDLIKKAVGRLEGRVVAFLGLSFKPNTDDVRNTRALPIIEKLYEEGAKVKAYDPQATNGFRRLTSLPIEYYSHWEEALLDADLAVVQSDWREIREIRAEDFKRLLKHPIIVDGRRTYNPHEMISKGIKYFGIGWKNTYDT